MAINYAEYVGLTVEVSALVEQFRQDPLESKCDILFRVLSGKKGGGSIGAPSAPCLDLGQGAKVFAGETLLLFLSDSAKRSRTPDGRAEVRADGLYVKGKKATKGNGLQAAMKVFQEDKNHRNESGKLISLNAWLKWHVARGDKLFSMAELKDPALAHRRLRELSLDELDKLLDCDLTDNAAGSDRL